MQQADLARISAEARQARPGRTLLLAIGTLLFSLGWVAAKALVLVWMAAAWSFVAMRLGWREAMRSSAARARGPA